MIEAGPWTAGEVPPPIVYQYVDSAGAPINLTGYTRAQFTYRTRTGVAVTRTATVTSAALGKVTYVWVQADLVAGRYVAEFAVDNGTNLFISEPIVYTVRSAVGAVPTIGA